MTRAARRRRLGISQPAWLASSSVASPCGPRRATGPPSAPRGPMSSDESPNVPAERDRRHAVREKAQQVQAQQSRARLIRTTSIATVDRRGRRRSPPSWSPGPSPPRHRKPLLSPANVTDDGFVVTTVTGVGSADETGTVDDEAAAQSLEAAPPRRPTPTRRRRRLPTADRAARRRHPRLRRLPLDRARTTSSSRTCSSSPSGSPRTPRRSPTTRSRC